MTALVIALTYGLVLAILPMEVFRDRVNYLNYSQGSALILARNFASGWLSTLVNEPIWLLLNMGLGLWLEPAQAVRILIFIPATVVAYKVIRSDPRHFMLLLFFLVVPQVIKNHIIHLRQGVAIAIFIFAWFMEPGWRRSIVLLTTTLIHASFFFIISLLALVKASQKMRLTPILRIFLFLAAGLGIAAMLTSLGQMVGARQAEEYEIAAANISGLGFVFWLAMFLVFCAEGKVFIRAHVFEIGTITFYLGTYFFTAVTARIFESGLLIILMAGLQLTNKRRFIFLFMLVSYTFISYLLSLNQPFLGFGD